jgi:hypothetical protein
VSHPSNKSVTSKSSVSKYFFNTCKTTIHILGENGRYLCGMEKMPKHVRADHGEIADCAILGGLSHPAANLDARICERCYGKKAEQIESVKEVGST